MSLVLALIPLAIAAATMASNRKIKNSSSKKNLQIFPTKMKNKEILLMSLENLGCKINLSESKIEAIYLGKPVIFERNFNNIYEAIIVEDASVGLADIDDNFLFTLNEEYNRLIQLQVYNNLLQHAQKSGFILESDELKADNSIVLTFNIEEINR